MTLMWYGVAEAEKKKKKTHALIIKQKQNSVAIYCAVILQYKRGFVCETKQY